MRVKVTETQKASPNGILVELYEAGETYDMPEQLAEVFVREGWGVDVDAPVAPAKTKPAAPKNRKG